LHFQKNRLSAFLNLTVVSLQWQASSVAASSGSVALMLLWQFDGPGVAGVT
jgi:hypothetical protein